MAEESTSTLNLDLAAEYMKENESFDDLSSIKNSNKSVCPNFG